MANLTHTWTDDDGSGTVGTIINNSQLQTVYQNTGRADNHVCQGRLTLTSQTAVTTADVTGATTIYFSPYGGDAITLYDGVSSWVPVSFLETGIVVPNSASQMYDVFGFNNGGTFSLELLAWTNDTTRATGLLLQNGVYVKGGVTTRRYLGSFRTTVNSGQTEDSQLRRYVWNYYNRVRRPFIRVESTSSWAGTNNSTPRQLNGSASNQIEVVVGVAESPVWVSVNCTTTSTAVNVPTSIGVGFDSTSSVIVLGGGGGITAGSNLYLPLTASGWHQPTIGRHIYAAIEESQTGQSTTFYGSGNASFFSGTYQPGILGWIEG